MSSILTTDEIKTLTQFNAKANQILNSSYLKEVKEKKLGYELSWNLNEQTGNLDFNYKVSNHDEDFIKSLVLTLRMFVQDNESISIHNVSEWYCKMKIDQMYKDTFNDIRKYLNDYLDDKARTFLDSQPTKRELFETVIYGELAHVNPEKAQLLERWKSNKIEWDVAFVEFQRILHEFIQVIKMIKELNEKVLKKYANM